MKEFRYDSVPVLETSSGKVKGYFYGEEYIFKGIPYAYADRFQMPGPYVWEGVWDATSYGYVCPLMDQERPSGEMLVPHRYWLQDEHCQNLNIWTKTLDKKAAKPVLVWLHGGGYAAGSSIEQAAYDGYNLCMAEDVVVVSVNHRLNILGYLDLEPFGEKYKNSGNAGHGDLVAALRWVKDNIGIFGGDPENITVFGQSGGGMKAADLIQIPEADGLFQKVMIMSGVGCKEILPTCRGDGREIVEALLKELGCSRAEELETVPYSDLAEAYKKVSPAVAARGGYVGGGPLAGDYYRGNPLEYGMRERGYAIPMMIGSVFGEFSFRPAQYDKRTLSEDESEKILEKVYGNRTQEIIRCFKETYPGKHILDVLCIDRVMRQPSRRLAKLHAEGRGAGTFLYNFTLEFPIQGGKPAWHCSDIPFFFHNTDKVEICGMPGVSERLEAQMAGALGAFARTGDPSLETLVWEPVTEEREPSMIFDEVCRLQERYDDELYRMIDEILPPFDLMKEMAEQDVQH